MCSRGTPTKHDMQMVESMTGPLDNRTLTIPCSNKEHEDCGGDGCECECHNPIML